MPSQEKSKLPRGGTEPVSLLPRGLGDTQGSTVGLVAAFSFLLYLVLAMGSVDGRRTHGEARLALSAGILSMSFL